MRRRFFLVLWSLAASAGAAPLDSRCPTGAEVDATFRDAAVDVVERRFAVRAPGRDADGAVRLHDAAAHLDPGGGRWQRVSAYQANLGLVGALAVAPRTAPVVARWLRWQARHSLRLDADGVVLDHWLRVPDLAESTCPPGIGAQLCDHVDAHDSTAASLLLMADAYRRHAGADAATVLDDALVRRALVAAARTLAALAAPGELNGLTWAKPDHRVAYLMDAVEVAAGWRAWARVQREVYRDAAGADAADAAATRVDAAVQRRLWRAPDGPWRVSAGAVAAHDAGRWYPDAIAQAWPLLWSGALDDAGLARARGAWRRAVGARNEWARRSVDPAGFWWPAAAVAALCTGDAASARIWVARARRAWLAPRSPFDWPFHVGDLLWLAWLADPPATAAATDLPRTP